MTPSSTISSRPSAALPAILSPMMAVSSAHLPPDPQPYSFEYKWDGVRAIARYDGSHLQLYSRNLLNITSHYPELSPLAQALGRHRVLLDGEIIAVDPNDQPSFAQLQRRMHVRIPSPRLVAEVPVYYVIFDLLHLDRRSTLRLPLTDRQHLLEQLTLAGPSWRLSPASLGDGQTLLTTARQNRLEGVLAKRADSPYLPGRRSPLWLKIKVIQRQEFVVGAYAPQETAPDTLGTLQLGYYDPAGQLQYAGSVGTGFNQSSRHRLLSLLHRLHTRTNPFAAPPPRRDMHYVLPTLVAEIEYRRWPAGGLLQQASFKGLRTDKSARSVVRECPI